MAGAGQRPSRDAPDGSRTPHSDIHGGGVLS
jgi:hypothetical protein